MFMNVSIIHVYIKFTAKISESSCVEDARGIMPLGN